MVDNTPWESKTLSNTHELEAQSTLICNQIQNYQNSSSIRTIAPLDQLIKGAQIIMHLAVLLGEENIALRKACEAASQCKAHKRKQIQKGGTLTKEAGTELAAQKCGGGQNKGREAEGEVSNNGTIRKKRRCKHYGETGHNSRTCKAEV